MRRSLLLLALTAACGRDTTVVVVTVSGGTGQETPVAGQPLVIVPYDRDSVVAALGAPWLARRPDTMPMIRLLDTLRAAYQNGTLGRVRELIEPRLEALRQAEHDWRDSAYRTYDSVTFALVKRVARDPFTDTTDAQGMARVRPIRSGPWWVTVTAWDADDPYSEWYWNVPLVGDTLRLTSANARHRRRF